MAITRVQLATVLALSWTFTIAHAEAAKRTACCVWSKKNVAALDEAIAAAHTHGLHASQLGVASLNFKDGRRLTKRDAQLTGVALRYAALLEGTTTAKDEAPLAKHRQRLALALRRGTLSAWFSSLAPKGDDYAKLKATLADYRSMADVGGWEEVTNRRKLKLGAASKSVLVLKCRLEAEGDLTELTADEVFDAATELAVKRFQTRHGLVADGIVGPATRNALDVSVGERIRTIEANLARRRSFSRALPATRIEVNAAAALLTLYEDHVSVLRMKVVVGKPEHDTPMLTSAIRNLIINPQWVVPQSIATKEILPRLEDDPDYLERNRMSQVGGYLVQAPGPGNALGRIKFDFPNAYRVYLHDTPARSLFGAPDRAQSHGCVRVEHPLDLAEKLMQNDVTWNRQAIEKAIEAGDTRVVQLPRRMPIVIGYWTAFVEEDGAVHFRPDIYKRDVAPDV